MADMAENNRAVIKLREKFASSILEVKEFRGEVTVIVRKEDIVALCKFLKEELRYNLLTDVTAVDYLGKDPRFMVVYNIYSIPNKDRLRIKAPVTEGECTIDTVCGVWTTANWLEREAYDLMGIIFKNHPDLRRIMMTDDWVGHPLRKDYPLQGPDREPYKGRLS
ncbi:NADH dehydrogenase subunit C [Geotalea uraniireducens Rf4]|uniref:NADH-quinone oxidoreductase subunit C n=2 Tax=Geotalea uraniireducens TaxID=351604 RepID=NUOC_GEOUR|nr:RecName: Full=NADH-quinone oxidoreductase subunit C; AltName: Full=NADH dehydrogenase I subunit C; AltName: Full=NDH-1 subunit C [Geotalea uraniireducens Rf4]ABQ28385.1 NADH dehydrogenase subunit C [Geotalea uraniireducens Rf4]